MSRRAKEPEKGRGRKAHRGKTKMGEKINGASRGRLF